MITYVVDDHLVPPWIDRAPADPPERRDGHSIRIVVLPSAAHIDPNAPFAVSDSLEDATWEDAEWR